MSRARYCPVCRFRTDSRRAVVLAWLYRRGIYSTLRENA